MTSFQIEDIETSSISTSHPPPESFMYVLRAKETIRQYPKRLKIFFDCRFVFKLSLEEQSNIFYKNSIKNNNWTFLYFKKFIEYQKTRVASGEITGTTIHDYYKLPNYSVK